MDHKVTKAIVVSSSPSAPEQSPFYLSLFDESNQPIDFTSRDPQTGADVVLTGLNLLAGTSDPIENTDTVNDAVAKLQTQLDSVTSRLDALET